MHATFLFLLTSALWFIFQMWSKCVLRKKSFITQTIFLLEYFLHKQNVSYLLTIFFFFLEAFLLLKDRRLLLLMWLVRWTPWTPCREPWLGTRMIIDRDIEVLEGGGVKTLSSQISLLSSSNSRLHFSCCDLAFGKTHRNGAQSPYRKERETNYAEKNVPYLPYIWKRMNYLNQAYLRVNVISFWP